jgi:hypothetical protein
MNMPPPISAISAASQGHDQDEFEPGKEAAAGGRLSDDGVAGSVVTSSGIDGVAASTGVAWDAEADVLGLAAAIVGRALVAEGAMDRAAGASSTVGVAGRDGGVLVVGVVAGRSAGRVTVPCRLKFCSCAGPIVSDDGAGAAVTSTGASLFWANAGTEETSASAAAVPLKALIVMRPSAVILPALLVLDVSAPFGPARAPQRLLAIK